MNEAAGGLHRRCSLAEERRPPALKRLGLSPGASQSNLKFTSALAQTVGDVDLVLEYGPERVVFKQKLCWQLDELLPPDVIIASSSSGLTMSEIRLGANPIPSAASAALDPAG